jgi:hypothetical protein
MARHRTTIEEWELYVPDVDEERQLFVEHPEQAITLEIKFLTKREREYFQRVAQRAAKGPEQRKRAEGELKRMLEDHVRDIKNVTIDDGAPVATGADLWESQEEDLKKDVAEALMSIGHLEAGLAKKLSTPSASLFSRQTKSAGGVAHAATPVSSQDRQET